MSRLDDELRKAFRREQPSADFTARLLERVAQQPEPKARWWQRFATLLDPPRLRWVAIGVTASLLMAIGAAQYSRLNQRVVSDNGKVAKAVAPRDEGVKAPEPTAPPHDSIVTAPKDKKTSLISKGSIKRGARPGNQPLETPRARQERELRAEGEAAKETLMFALSLASSALGDAQKAVHDDGLKP
ncbi:MAG TPA: hypothetical protein VLG74_01100 [Blastocatellia bacterium]|nr:hypothetical protein [Blastocatellia bacterium]